MRWLLLCLAIAGCARAGQENSIIGGLTDARPSSDADVPPADAAPFDAPPAQVTLAQTGSGAITPANSFACSAGGVTRPNSYYRVFTLADYNVTTTLHVTQVDFAIQTATAGQGAATQPATVKLGTYSGPIGGTTLDLAQSRAITSVDIQIPNGSATRMTVPITADVAPTASLIAELAIPDGSATGHKFFIGTNAGDERRPGYTLAPLCGFTVPTSMQSIADDQQFGTVRMILSVTGTTQAP